MPLIFNQRHLAQHNLGLRGELPLEELDLNGIDECIRVTQPLKHDLEVQLIEGAFLVRGSLALMLECTCVRCLKLFPARITLAPWVCHLMREGEEPVAIVNDCVDLTPYIREDMLLAFPQHPLCEPGCNGLPYKSISSVRQPSSVSPIEDDASAWAELNKLKL